jgi:putative peptidoglycan lipid II flippase
MEKFFTKTKELIFASQTSMLSSTIIISGMMLVARIFGFLRYRVLTGIFTTEELDVFFASFRIPDLIFEILITGALTTTFIPFFIKYKNNQEQQNKYISSFINFVLIAIFIAIVILIALMPLIIPVITPGFEGEKIRQITLFSQMLLVGQLPFLVIGNFYTGIAQARKAFIIPAIAPAVYNIAIIILTILFYENMHLMAPVIGVMAGSVLFLIVQMPIMRITPFRYRLVLVKSKEMWNMFKMAVPRMMTSIVSQIDATIDLSLTTLVGAGSYTMFYFAQHLQLLPISLIGIAFGQASLPYLTELYQEKKMGAFKKIIVESVLNLFYLTLPIMVFLIVARTPIVRLFYGGDKFDWDATVITARTLSFFALSLPLHAIYYFLTRCFYALFDSRTPFYISLFSIAFNATLSIYFIIFLNLPVWSLAISFSIGMNLNVLILFFILVRRLHGFEWRMFIVEMIKISAAVIISGCFLFFSQRLLDGLVFDTSRTINVFLLLMTNGILFVLLYLGTTWLVGVKEMYLLTRMILKLKGYQRKYSEVSTPVQ